MSMLKKSENETQYLNEKKRGPFFSETKIPLYLTLFASLALLCLVSFLAFQYIKAWPIAYSSDTALIGLMAKHILEFGERPIFVWSVGYQGIFLEGYLSAFFFGIFGVKPWVLNIAPSIYLVIASGIWMLGIAKSFGRTTAVISILLTTLTSPIWFHLCARSLPNFASIFLLGSLYFFIAQKCFREFQSQSLNKNRWLIALGLVAGFAQYTFAIHFYFISSTLIFAFLLLQRNLLIEIGFVAFLKNCAWPLRWLRAPNFNEFNQNFKGAHISIKALSSIAWIFALVGIATLYFTPESFQYRGRLIQWNALILCIAPLLLLFGINFLLWLAKISKQKKLFLEFKKSFYHVLIAYTMGYSPNLIHKFILGGKSAKSIGLKGTGKDIVDRFSYFIHFHSSQLSINFNGVWGWFVLFFFTLGILIFYVRIFKSLKILFKKSESNLDQIWPFQIVYGVFPIVVLIVFLLSRTVVDVYSVRYLVYLIPIYSTMIASSCVWLSARFKFGLMFSSVCIVLFAFQGWNRIQADLRIEQSVTAPALHEFAIQKAMQDRGIKYGYGDYWLAYSTVFIANESVIIEPLYSNYSPHYGEPVKNATRIAYVDFVPPKRVAENGILTINQQKYRILEELKITPQIEMKILDRI